MLFGFDKLFNAVAGLTGEVLRMKENFSRANDMLEARLPAPAEPPAPAIEADPPAEANGVHPRKPTRARA